MPGGDAVARGLCGYGGGRSAPATDTAGELWEARAASGVPALTIPHHSEGTTQLASWEVFDPRFVKLSEIFSVHGSPECFGCVVRVQRPKAEGPLVRRRVRGAEARFYWRDHRTPTSGSYTDLRVTQGDGHRAEAGPIFVP